MKKILLAALATVALVTPALASGTVQAFFGNTVETTNAGQTTKWHFDADGKAKAILPDGTAAPGAWVMKGDQFCVTVGQQPESCTPVTEGKGVGDSWASTNSAGQSFTVTIKAGR